MATWVDLLRDKVPSGASASFAPDLNDYLTEDDLLEMVSGMIPGGGGVLGGIKMAPRLLNPAFQVAKEVTPVEETARWAMREAPSWGELVAVAKDKLRQGDYSIMNFIERLGSPTKLQELQGGPEAIERKLLNIEADRAIERGIANAGEWQPIRDAWGREITDPANALEEKIMRRLESIKQDELPLGAPTSDFDYEVKRLVDALNKWRYMDADSARAFAKGSKGVRNFSTSRDTLNADVINDLLKAGEAPTPYKFGGQ